MKKNLRNRKTLYTSQVAELIFTLGDGWELEDADTIAVQVYTEEATKVTATTKITGKNVFEARLADTQRFAAGDIIADVTITSASGNVAVLMGVATNVELTLADSAITPTGTIRVAVPLYQKDLVDPFA